MEKETNPPAYAGLQVNQTGLNYPGPQMAYTPHREQQNSLYPPPPPYGFGAPSPGVQPTAAPVVTQVVMVSTLNDIPSHITCPHCLKDVVTETEHISGLLTWLICGTLAIFVCWPCCCIPFCVDACKDVKHVCPNCKNIIRIYKRM